MDRNIVRAQLLLYKATGSVGWTSTAPIYLLGTMGNILSVKVREDATAKEATAGVLYLLETNSDVSSAPSADDIVYESAEMALSGSATDASYEDALAVPAPYAVGESGRLRAAFDITADTGSVGTELYLTVWAEVLG